MSTNSNLYAVDERPPVQSEENPRGVRHIDKTVQDGQPVAERQRFKDWRKRQNAMKAAA